MTFQEIIDKSKKKYHTTNEVVIFNILYSLSEQVKDKLSFTQARKNQIDFDKQLFFKLLNQYFIKNEPLGSIIKKTQFYGLDIQIYDKIFNPRAETELLCQKAITCLKKDKSLINGFDLCCGTGVIGLAIKKNCPWVNITSIDINKIAINNTNANARLNNLKIKTINGDFYKSILKHKVDFIVCNPPYVNVKTLNKRMTKYETCISFNNGNPLLFYSKIINNYKKILSDTSHFLMCFEIGFDLKPSIIKLLKKNNLLRDSKFYKDYAGHNRLLIIDVNK